ncbi:MAG: hypothetical protein OEZ02_10065 [Anaerolineae bacterium]|nr:hypothetical protein [Anaerolineae bacterium]
MADVYAVFGTLLALGIAFPGLLTAWWLLFPTRIAIAQTRIERTPWKSFGMGIAGAIVLLIPLFVLFSMPFPFSKFLGAILLFGSLGFAGIGAAGLAAHMGKSLQQRTDAQYSPLGSFVRAAAALELAAAFPFLGWFIVIPLTLIASLGAAIFAALGWQAKPNGSSSNSPDPAAESPEAAGHAA